MTNGERVVHGLYPTSSELKYVNPKAVTIEADRDDRPRFRLNTEGVLIFDKEKVFRFMI